MSGRLFTKVGVAAVLGISVLSAEMAVKDSPDGIKFPSDYNNWRTIAVSHRTDHHSLRSILGNDIAIEAAREGKTNPWPNGAVLGKVVWKEKADPNWAAAIVPGELSHVEFMIKDDKKYEETGGWGYARWVGAELKPYGEGKNLLKANNECMACHTPVKNNDWVFTHPAPMPN